MEHCIPTITFLLTLVIPNSLNPQAIAKETHFWAESKSMHSTKMMRDSNRKTNSLIWVNFFFWVNKEEGDDWVGISSVGVIKIQVPLSGFVTPKVNMCLATCKVKAWGGTPRGLHARKHRILLNKDTYGSLFV